MKIVEEFLGNLGLKLEMCSPSWVKLVDKCETEADYRKVIDAFGDYHEIEEEEEEKPAPVKKPKQKRAKQQEKKPLKFGDFDEGKAKERQEKVFKRRSIIKGQHGDVTYNS